ncbi:MAG: hypothetical protein N2114_06110 [Candidatus Goldbacteria bacterium]|nr:hypothetical protein [Candidatus Goldiibacteriota bacterium]
MRKVIVIFLFIIHFNLNASVYDFIKEKINFSMPFISKEIKSMNIKINGNRIDILLLEANKSSEKALVELYEKAEKNGCDFYNSESILYIAELLYKIAGRKKYDDEFGYILYLEKNKKINFIITAGNGEECEIIKISSVLNNKKNGYDDGINHIANAKQIFSFEILSDYNKTLYFTNFYIITSADRYEIRNFYDHALIKSGFKLIKKYFDNKIDLFIYEKRKKIYLMAISEEQNENWLMVMG